MHSKIPIILLAFAALASHAAEPLILQWGTIPAATPNRIYTLLWTTDLSIGEWTELPLGVGNPSTANPLPIVDAPSLFVCVRVELPSDSPRFYRLSADMDMEE